ncbi:MAG: hypothetical protein PHZ00_04290 [Candidatus Peribacteraceae bacterium]|nr:hypothetical protein [Candidatus Peribacteraceae bacterium]
MGDIEAEPSLAKTLESMQQGTIDPEFLVKNVVRLREQAKLLSNTAQAQLQNGIAKWLTENKTASDAVRTALDGFRQLNTFGGGIPGKALDIARQGTSGVAKDLGKGVENLAKLGDKQIKYFMNPAVPVSEKVMWGGAIAGLVYGAKKVVDWAKEDSWRGTIVRGIGLAALGGWLLNHFAPQGATLADKKDAATGTPETVGKPLPGTVSSEKEVVQMPTPEPFRTKDAVPPPASPLPEKPRVAA